MQALCICNWTFHFDKRVLYKSEMKTTTRMEDGTYDLIKLTGVVIVVFFLAIKWRIQNLPLSFYHGRYVMITGCDTGFGFQFAKSLDSMGFSVFAGCFTEKGALELKKCCSNNLLTLTLDVTRPESIQEALIFVKSILPANKGLWGLVNNAEFPGHIGNGGLLNRNSFNAALDINLLGVIDVTQAFLPLLKMEKGRIVNLSSIAGRIAAADPPYVVSKFALEGYNKCLRRDLYKTGVTVHTIEPGFCWSGEIKDETCTENCVKSFWHASEGLQRSYGDDNDNKPTFDDFSMKVLKYCSSKPYKVVNACIHVLCGRFPKTRYVIGYDANIAYRVLWNLPEWMSDFFSLRFYLYLQRVISCRTTTVIYSKTSANRSSRDRLENSIHRDFDS